MSTIVLIEPTYGVGLLNHDGLIKDFMADSNGTYIEWWFPHGRTCVILMGA